MNVAIAVAAWQWLVKASVIPRPVGVNKTTIPSTTNCMA